jgi:DAK2 domain fusion protein YloV
MNYMNGQEIRQAFDKATRYLEQYRDTINALNVFPVPDGDTGTNMLLTMRSAMKQPNPNSHTSVATVAAAMADGAFLGARGNSGVILSQFFKGLAEGLQGKEFCGAIDLGRAFHLATEMAYKSVANPVEGTMLTVIHSLSLAAKRKLDQGEDDPRALWNAAYIASREALIRTQDQMPVLHKAGVVDAGGMGIVIIIGGAFAYITGHPDDHFDLELEGPPYTLNEQGNSTKIDLDYLDATDRTLLGYCIQFLIANHDLNLNQIRDQFSAISDSSVVVSNDQFIRIHTHSLNPGPAISYGISLGELSQINIENMNGQNREFISMHRANQEIPHLAVVAVAPGEGLAHLFREYGCAAVVAGGDAINSIPSQLLNVAMAAGIGDVIILPNNKNILATTEEWLKTNTGRLHIIPSCTVPQGVAALLAFNPENTLDQNMKAMRKALCTITTVEVSKAVGSTIIGGQEVSAGKYLGLLEEKLAVVGESPEIALQSALIQTGLSSDKVVTVYWGAATSQEQAEVTKHELEKAAPGIQIDLVYGGQSNCIYLASVE